MDLTQPLLQIVERLVDLVAIQIPDLEAKMAKYADDVAALQQAASDISNDVKAVAQKFADLKAQIASGSEPDVTGLESAISALQGSHGDLQTAVSDTTSGGTGQATGAPKASGSLHPKHP